MIVIVDYGSGNISAIGQILNRLGVSWVASKNLSDIDAADRYILPGVGHYKKTVDTLQNSGIKDALTRNILEDGKYLLGICVGMQILSFSSEEGDGVGLGLVNGSVRKINKNPMAQNLLCPHMGWNSLSIDDINRDLASGLLDGVDLKKGFYFLHSYYFDAPAENVIARTTYGFNMPCIVTNQKNIFGVQFHPEKSHLNGVRVIENFTKLK